MFFDLNGRPYRRTIVFDVETTGLSPEAGDRVIEIGAVALEGGKIADEFHSLIDTDRAIDPAAQRVHGITRGMLAGQPKPKKVMPKFRAFIEDSIMVAHYADFDLSMVGKEFRRLKIEFRQPYFCTLSLARKLFPELERHDLGSIYRHLFKTEPVVMHRALEDAKSTAEIWILINRIMSDGRNMR